MSSAGPPPLPPEYIAVSAPEASADPLKLDQPTVAPDLRTSRRSSAGILISMLLAVALIYPIVRLNAPAKLVSQRAQIAATHGRFQLDNEEGALLYQALELSRGHSIYRPLDNYPYVVGTYPPLYMFVTSWTIRDSIPSFSQGRILGWVCALGIAVVIALLIAIRTHHITAGAIAALLYVCTWEVYQWIAYYRVDFPAIYISLVGLAFIALAPRYAPARVLSLLCFTVALFTKQTVIAAPIAACLALLVRDWRMGLRYTVSLAVMIAIPFAVLTAATRGQYATHTIFYNMNTYHPSDLRNWLRHVWFMHHWMLIATGIAMLGAAVVTALRRSETLGDATAEQSAGRGFWRDFAADPIYLYGLFACLSFFAIAKAGTAENYLLEPIIGIVLMLGYSIGRLSSAITWRAPGFLVALLTLIASVTAIFIHVSTVVSPEAMQIRFNPGRNPRSVDFRAAGEVTGIVRNEMKPTWTELAIFNLSASRDPVLQPFIMSELARQGRWDQKPFLEDLKNQKFGLIVTQLDVEAAGPNEVYTNEMIDTMRNYYEEEKFIRGLVWPGYHILRPRKEPREKSFDKYLADAK